MNWTVNKWNIEKLSNTELRISNEYESCYAYINKGLDKLVVDRIIYPKYIEKIAIKIANKNIVSIYA